MTILIGIYIPNNYKSIRYSHIRYYMNPFGNSVVGMWNSSIGNYKLPYLDDDIIEWAFEYIKTADPTKDFRVHSDIVHDIVTIEYLSDSSDDTQEAAATREPDDVEIVYVNQESKNDENNNTAKGEKRRKIWKEMRNQIQEENETK